MKFATLITSISATADMKLLNLLKTRFHLQTHLKALKQFMLLGQVRGDLPRRTVPSSPPFFTSQGDFVTCLMDGVGPELRKRATQLYRHNLTGILESALRSSNAQFQPPFVLDRIGIRLLDAAPGDSEW
jgi:gamma-tubulin complex component 3